MASILLDQNIPRGLRRLLIGHDVKTAFHTGWADLVNGELIAAAEAASFDVLITADKSLRYQQNLAGRRLSLVVIESNTWPLVRINLGVITTAVKAAQPGGFQEVAFSRHRP